MDGTIFDIQKLTLHDGPGIRTTVFLKGCPLHCAWCSNPEGLAVQPQVGVYGEKCIGVENCGFCIQECPEMEQRALIVEKGRVTGINRAVCTDCLRCADVCPTTSALKIWGRKMSVNEVVQILLSDQLFFNKSGGGVTLSGGEVFVQWRFALELLKACRKAGIHRCVESTLHCRREALRQVLAETDFVITDLKHMDPGKHKEKTGLTNATILANIERAVRTGLPLILRIPVVAGFNNDEDNIRATAKFVLDRLENRVKQIQLIPYRELGIDKYQALGLDYPMKSYRAPIREQWEKNIRHLARLMASYGIPAVAGTSVKYAY